MRWLVVGVLRSIGMRLIAVGVFGCGCCLFGDGTLEVCGLLAICIGLAWYVEASIADHLEDKF